MGAVVDLREALKIEMRIDLGCSNVRVPKKLLDCAQLSGGLQEVAGTRVTQKVGMYALGNTLLERPSLQAQSERRG